MQILQRFRWSNPYICLCDHTARVSPKKIKGATATEGTRSHEGGSGMCANSKGVVLPQVWGQGNSWLQDQGLLWFWITGHCGRRALWFWDSFLGWVTNVLWSLRHVIWSVCDSALCLKQWIKVCFCALVRCHKSFMKGTLLGIGGLVSSVTMKCCCNMLMKHF